MSKLKLSPEIVAQNKKRTTLNALCQSISMALTFKSIKTWGDVYKYTSVPPNATSEHLNSLPKHEELQAYLRGLKEQLEQSFVSVSGVPTSSEQTAKTHIQPIPKESPTFTIVPPKVPDKLEELDASVDTTKPCVENDYLLPPCTGEKKGMIKYWHQRKAAKELLDGILVHNLRGQQLIAAAGYGKTFIAGAVAARLKDMKFADDKTFGSTKYLYVTKNTVVEQTRRVFEKMFGLTMFDGFEVINYEALRSKAGQLWVKEEVKIVDGEEEIHWVWRPMLNPVVVFWDENQSLKNSSSTQHQVASFFNEIKTPTFQIFISATPYTRVCEAKCFAVATKKDITDIIGLPTKLSNNNWPTYAKYMAKDSAPEEYNEAAVERLTKDLEQYIVRVRGVKPQFHAINRVKMIKFATKEEQQYYDDTEERYYREKAKLENDKAAGVNVGVMHLVLLTKRSVAAEFCRVPHFAKHMQESIEQGKAAACAVKYKPTLIQIVKYGVEHFGWKRDEISLVWGGGQTQLTKKQKIKAEVKAKAEALEKAGLSAAEMLKELELEDVEDRVLEELPPELRLGGQSKEERQREIDKFQSGKTNKCIYTFKAGGVGLSLHHTDELCTDWDRSVPGFAEWHASIMRMHERNRPAPGKVRRQKSGAAVEEDIKFIPTKQRRTCLSVSYSAIDMVQSTGRVPRLTSLSDTEQDCMLYAGTVEEDIARVYSSKLKCLSKAIKGHESWADLIADPKERARIVSELIKNDEEYAKGEVEGEVESGESEDE